MAKTWFITGTSSGIGRLLTEQLLARGDRVAATVRKADALADLKARYGEQLWLAQLDVTEPDAIRTVVRQAFSELGRIDVVVSNAGYGLFGAAEEVSDAQIRHQIDTNLIGSIQLIRAVLPYLRDQGGGRVVQVSSEGGQVTYPNFSLYHATKWGIEGFVETVAMEVAPFNIGLTIIEPGPTRTGFSDAKVSPPTLAVYANTPADLVRQALSNGVFKISGDAGKVAQAIINSTEQNPAPLRVTLGKGSYERVSAALKRRLDALEAQKEIAFSADMDE